MGSMIYRKVGSLQASLTLDFIGHDKHLIEPPFMILAVLHMDPDWSYIDFLNAASNRLELVPAAKRVFNTNGTHSDPTFNEGIAFLALSPNLLTFLDFFFFQVSR